MSKNGKMPLPLIRCTLEGWRAEAVRRFGPDPRKWKFVCPGCGQVQCGEDFIAAGIDRAFERVWFSCIGRWTGGRSWLKEKDGQPCDYTNGGLFCIAPVEVTKPDGTVVPVFGFAEGL